MKVDDTDRLFGALSSYHPNINLNVEEIPRKIFWIPK